MTLLKNRKILLLILFLLGIVVLLTILALRLGGGEEKKELSVEEQRYPNVITTVEQSSQTDNSGVLVVNSDPEGARVVIDPPEEEAGDSKPAVVNETPFKSNLPTGKHTITAFLNGFQFFQEEFTIKKGEITRIDIKLIPDGVEESSTETEFQYGKWIAQLPITNPNYYAEYDRDQDLIRAYIYPEDSLYGQREAMIESIKEEVRKRLKEIGVDLNKERIEWEVR